ncbi:caspase family protein [Nonomuraea insulae]|uniref:Caspase domain-containing protein n=1 Tax=Nonomuraea insulae TaxID=1616787 RepID=A0ABW1D8K5_9ACTN
MRRALLTGIDHYENMEDLAGCGNDATALHTLLSRNEDNSPNMSCRMLVSGAQRPVTRDQLLTNLESLLAPGSDLALFYFAGHGQAASNDVTLVTSDGAGLTWGVRFVEILEQIRASKVNETIVILDCCFAGAAGGLAFLTESLSAIPTGVSILAATRHDQPSLETAAGRGQFSTYLEGGLDGGAADVLGHVNVAGLYAYLSESFGSWEQRPAFKANIDRLHDVRLCEPSVPPSILRRLPVWFPEPNGRLPLDPSYEPDAEPHEPVHEEIFAQLQKCRAAKLVEPVGTEHMYYAAMHGHGCRLTPLGRHYWSMAKAGRI